MTAEKNESPFAALSYAEQQRRWLAWRSRQLDYRPAGEDMQKAPPPAPLRTPNLPLTAPPRHRELDRVLLRHRQALRRAGAFRDASAPQ